MTRFNASTAAIVVTAIVALTALGAQEPELQDLLDRLPAGCVVVAGSADVPSSFNALSRWVDPVVRALADESAIGILEAVGRELPVYLIGPAVVGIREDQSWVFLAQTEMAPAGIVRMLEGLGIGAQVGEGIIAFHPECGPSGFVAVREGCIFASDKEETLRELLAPPAPGKPPIRRDPDAAALLGRREAREASFFLYTAAGLLESLLEKAVGEDIRMAALRRVAAALLRECHLDSPSLACLHIGEQSVRLTGTIRLPGGVPLAERTLLPPELPEEWPYRLWGSGADFASRMDRVEALMEALDPDVAAEFREEMAELNADLGYDFQRDLLGNLGPWWVDVVLPARNGEDPEQVFACGLRRSDQFIRCAEGLARLAQEPWEEVEPLGGLRCFSTLMFTEPLELAVGEDRLLVARSAPALRTMHEGIGEAKVTSRETRHVWAVQGIATLRRIGELLLEEEESPALRLSLLKVPSEARALLRVGRFPNALRLEIEVEGITPQELSDSLMPPVEEAGRISGRNTYIRNLCDVGIAITLYRNDNAGEYPATLADLVPKYVPARKLVCPGDENPMTIAGDIKCSYHYVGKLLPNVPVRVIIVHDKAGNHEGGRNALFADAHVEWMEEDEFQATMKQSLELLKREGWDKYSPEQQKAIEAFYAGQR